jgi:hypothetical protein
MFYELEKYIVEANRYLILFRLDFSSIDNHEYIIKI